MLNKILAASFLLLFVGKIFFKPQFGALKKWFDGVVNAMLIAIALVYSLQLLMWLTSGASQ